MIDYIKYGHHRREKRIANRLIRLFYVYSLWVTAVPVCLKMKFASVKPLQAVGHFRFQGK